MALIVVCCCSRQLHRMVKVLDPTPNESVLLSLFKVVSEMGFGSVYTLGLRANI